MQLESVRNAAILTRGNRVDEPRRPVLVGLSTAGLRVAVTEMITACGHEVVSLADGYHLTQTLAGAILGEDAARPRLIITNPILPGCTGVSLLAGLRELGWDTPVIFLIGADDPAARAQTWSPEVTAVFVEPVDLRELGALVALLLDPEVGEAFGTLRVPRWIHSPRLAEGTNPGVK